MIKYKLFIIFSILFVACGYLFTAKEDIIHHNHHKMINHDEHAMHRPDYAWRNPAIKPSPPPNLVGKQMGIMNTIGVQPMGYEMDGNVKVFRLIAQPVKQYITDGKKPDYDAWIEDKNRLPSWMPEHSTAVQKIKAWGYNGSTPGPTIEVNEGDRVRILVTNQLPEPTSIHWHGIEVPNSQDGTAGFTSQPIMPGETFTYEFPVYQSGTFFYHGEFNFMKQSSYGLVGAFVIHPKKYEERKPDKQFVIMLQEWAIPPGSEDPNLVTTDFNWFTFNGHATPMVPAMQVHEGEYVRIRIINMSMDDHPIHLHGHTWWVVGTEGGPIPKSAQWPGNSVDVPPGSSRDVEFIAWNPGLWFFHCHKLHHVINAHAEVPLGIMPHGGMFTILRVIPNNPKAPWRHPKEVGN